MGEKTNGDRVVVGKHEEKIPLGRPRNRCRTEIDLKERMGWGGMVFFWLKIGTSGNNNKLSGSTKCAESDQPRSFS